jgi:hypothetical protein
MARPLAAVVLIDRLNFPMFPLYEINPAALFSVTVSFFLPSLMVMVGTAWAEGTEAAAKAPTATPLRITLRKPPANPVVNLPISSLSLIPFFPSQTPNRAEKFLSTRLN